MIRKKKIVRPYFFLVTILFVSLSGMGITYAKWSDGLNIRGDFSTGIMDVIYSEEVPCMISLTDGDGMELEGKQEAEAVILDDGKTMDITAPLPLNTEEFLEQPDQLIKLEYPIKAGNGGTINRVELLTADFKQEPQEELVLRPVRMVLIPVDETQEYQIPEAVSSDFDAELVFDVFRETREENGIVMGVLYLRMKEESRDLLSEFPVELEFEEDELEIFSPDAHLVITYECSVPIYMEQGHDDSAQLQQAERQQESVD